MNPEKIDNSELSRIVESQPDAKIQDIIEYCKEKLARELEEFVR